jgi:hypothetical protein
MLGHAVVTRIQTSSGNIGYRCQLARAGRFLERIEKPKQANEVEFQDMMWAFFQNCWHIKDWMSDDPVVPEATKLAVIKDAHESPILKLCQELCNVTKHLGEHSGEAKHLFIAITVDPEKGVLEMDCTYEEGSGAVGSAKELARRCFEEWRRILKSHCLPA